MSANTGNDSRTGSELALGRREFLKVTTSSVVAIALTSPVAVLAGGPAAPIPSGGPSRSRALAARVSLGYWSGEYADTFVDAASLPAGDASLAGDPVTVEIAGKNLASLGRSQTLSRFTVDVGTDLYPDHLMRLGHFEYRAFENASAPATARLSLDAGQSLAIGVGLAAGQENATRSVRFSLTPGSSAGTAKLRRGYYAIAVTEDRASAAPDWSQYQAWSVPAVDGLALVNRDNEIAPFSYVLFSVEA